MQKPIIFIEDMTRVARQSRRPGCEKGVMHVEKTVQSAIFRVAPGSGVPGHTHSNVSDCFVGVSGVLEIRYERAHEHGVFVLKQGGFCVIPPDVKHEIFNASAEDAYFLSMHAPHDSYDFIPAPFEHLAPALKDGAYVATQAEVAS